MNLPKMQLLEAIPFFCALAVTCFSETVVVIDPSHLVIAIQNAAGQLCRKENTIKTKTNKTKQIETVDIACSCTSYV